MTAYDDSKKKVAYTWKRLERWAILRAAPLGLKEWASILVIAWLCAVGVLIWAIRAIFQVN